jgi:hypothetical protein
MRKRKRSGSVPSTGLGLFAGLGAALFSPPETWAAPEPSGAFADALRVVSSGRYGGRGTDLIPLMATPVQLRGAEVRLAQVPDRDSWQVSASYDLYNPGRAATSLSLLFPEEICEPGAGHECSPMRGAFVNPVTRFGGQPLEFALSSVDVVRKWTAMPGKGYVYQLTVPPRRVAHLSHEYQLDRTSGGEWWGVHYISAGGSFAGPIASVRYVVEVAQPLRYVVFPRAFTLRGFTEEPGSTGHGSLTRLTFTVDKVAERTDFLVAFPGAAVSGQSAAGFCAGFRGDKSPSELTQIVRGYDLARLRACREHLLSLHGFPFKDPGQRARYYRYTPRLPDWADEASFTVAAHPENPAFADSLLSAGEQAYLKALTDAEPHPR